MCNLKEAEDCVSKWQRSGMKKNKKNEMTKCLTLAGCEVNYHAMTDEIKRSLAVEYNTSVDTMTKAYTQMDN